MSMKDKRTSSIFIILVSGLCLGLVCILMEGFYFTIAESKFKQVGVLLCQFVDKNITLFRSKILSPEIKNNSHKLLVKIEVKTSIKLN